jgi:hypothetical protein
VPGVLSFSVGWFSLQFPDLTLLRDPNGVLKALLMTDATLWNCTRGPRSRWNYPFCLYTHHGRFEHGTSEARKRTQDLASSCLVLNSYTIWGPQSQVFLMRGKEGLMGCLDWESNIGPSTSSMLALPLSHTMAILPSSNINASRVILAIRSV